DPCRRYVSGRFPAGLFGPLPSTKIHPECKTGGVSKSRRQIIHRSALVFEADPWPDRTARPASRSRLRAGRESESHTGCTRVGVAYRLYASPTRTRPAGESESHTGRIRLRLVTM